jgi:hypothetical protein
MYVTFFETKRTKTTVADIKIGGLRFLKFLAQQIDLGTRYDRNRKWARRHSRGSRRGLASGDDLHFGDQVLEKFEKIIIWFLNFRRQQQHWCG